MVVFSFSILNWKHCFWSNLVEKIKNCQFKLKFGTKINSNMLNLMVVFTLSILNQKHPFLGKFGIRTTNMDTKKTQT